jgi:ABC-type nickel/cobalt efflux system permease component RcnA
MRNDKQSRCRSGFVLILGLFLLIGSATCFAHPMGNFSVNHYSKITIGQKSIEILYLVDMAEIPTYQEMRQFELVPKPNDPSVSNYLDRQEPLLKAGLTLESNGKPLQFETVERHVTFAEGAGGLLTMKITFVFRSQPDFAAGVHQLSYADNNFPGRAGWKEIVVRGDRAEILNSSAPATDRSLELTTYSSDALNSPPQQLSAAVSYSTVATDLGSTSHSTASASTDGIPSETNISLKSSAPRVPSPQPQQKSLAVVTTLNRKKVGQSNRGVTTTVAATQLPVARAQNTPRSRFTELISTQSKLSLWVLFSAALIAAGLGALHALEPGHGKTIVAAYLVGSRGTARHAVLLGIVVTAAHTSGVFLLGAVTLYASRYIVPEQLYPWLGAISGLSVAGLGIFTFLRHWTGESGEHSHAPGEQHSHWFLSMFKQRAPEQNTPALAAAESQSVRQALSLRELCILGITGGIVPCPAALVVLLSAFSLHRIGFGLFLITAFSVGLAAVLVMVGLMMVYTKRLMAARVQASSAALRYLPFLSSAFMVVLGVGITVSAIGSVQFWHGLISTDKLVPFVTVVLLGLFLGIRHSTDPDHVVAVSTIVSRQGSIRSSAAIGLLWGLGHTLTIFFVGSAIIIFGVVIPPRLGLSMEFCVALMLILLGVLNLTGVMSWIRNRFTPKASEHALPENSGKKYPRSETRVQSLIARIKKVVGNLGVYQTLRPLVVGLVHGLAGSAAVALLVLSTIKSPFWSTAYLLVFGFGTMVGMMLMTAAISVPVIYTGKKFFNVSRHLTVVSGVASVAFGMFLVYQIGFVDGLFTSHVHWIPQ